MFKKSTVIFLFLFILLVVGWVLYFNSFYNPPNIEVKKDTVTVNDTIWKTDSFEVIKPIPKVVKVVKTDTVFTEKGDTIQLVTENKIYQDTIVCKKDTAELQIFTSGINAQVDSINLKLRKSELIKTNTITITKYIEKPKKLFNIQPQCTFGYDPLNRNWGAVIGIGVGINI